LCTTLWFSDRSKEAAPSAAVARAVEAAALGLGVPACVQKPSRTPTSELHWPLWTHTHVAHRSKWPKFPKLFNGRTPVAKVGDLMPAHDNNETFHFQYFIAIPVSQ
jgi:hypothetical protein